MSVLRPVGLSVVVLLASLVLPALVRADCRDAHGEPVACPELAPPPPPAAPPPAPAPVDDAPPPKPVGDSGYFDFAMEGDFLDLRGLRFTPDQSDSVADVARGGSARGFGGAFDEATFSFSFAFGYRPLPWLRLPELRLGLGGGDLGGATVPLVGGMQPLTASAHELFVLRATVSGGVDIDLEHVRLFALAHVGVSGWFARTSIGGSALGGLGTDTFSTSALELGWTVGMVVPLDDGVAYSFGYRHVHTDAESNVVFFGASFRID
jgi:hypothetical protein